MMEKLNLDYLWDLVDPKHRKKVVIFGIIGGVMLAIIIYYLAIRLH
jgi:hypothetical protein